MNTSTQYPRHRFTAETFKRIDQLYTGSSDMSQRAARHRANGNYVRAHRCDMAAYRMQRRAFELGMLALTARELSRLCDINQAEIAARKAATAAKAA